MVRRTALTAMEMNGSEGLVTRDYKYIRVTLGKIEAGDKSATGGKRTQSAPAKSISRTTF
jgi:hypothetical protein